MSKYSFDRINPGDFESMAQALLEQNYRIAGKLIQFGPGADGGREATWTQPIVHPDYHRPSNQNADVPKEWVFQVKYHDIGLRGWTTARDVVVDELENELEKIVNKYKVPCHAYVMITNVPFTGVRDLGTRDRISVASQKWKDHVPEIYVWDASDLSRMLDANESVRTAYIETILPGDLIKAICRGISFRENRSRAALRAYLEFVTDREGTARAEEAGDEPGLPLADVFIDLTMKPCHEPYWEPERISKTNSEDTESSASIFPENNALTPSSFSLLIADHDRTLILGGPGLGKSTLTQFVSIYHSARLVNPALATKLANRLKLPDTFSPEKLDAHCRLRIPFRIELRRYARWMSEEQRSGRHGEMARYIAEELINPNVSSSLNMDDIFAVVSTDPILLVLDGLDEVPHLESRKLIRENLQIFLRRAQAENADVKLLFSSRPKGYSGEFTVFEPFTWELNDLSRNDFHDYCNYWLDCRIRDAAEKKEAYERIDRGMKSEAVRLLAQSLLQATVMLTIVRRKSEIPHQRHALYAKYVEVIFDREKEKSQVVREHGAVLIRLHERVGYELHCKMEQTNIEALDSNSFRNFVLNVLEDYSGCLLGQKKIGEVANEIITAATDRLCLLIGKGKEQAEIDFVVQSYREYFAAAYLFNHPDADPDSVFTALVRRGGYWANVLQFYVAQANANQQMRWVMNADCDHDYSSADEVVSLTCTRRALINVLPEFKLQRNSDFNRALRVIFSPLTRWTWLEQTTIYNTLRVLRSGDLYITLKELFNDFTEKDAGIFAVELKTLAHLSSRNPKNQKNYLELVEALYEHKEARIIVLATALENKLPLNITQYNISCFRQPGIVNDIREEMSLSHLFSRQNHARQCELLLAGFLPKNKQNTDIFAALIEIHLGASYETKLFDNSVSLRFSPYLCRNRENITALIEIRNELSICGNPSAAYLEALAHAAIEPTNLELDQRARALEESFVDGVSFWYAENIIGPPVTAFSSPQKWVEFKQKLSSICMENPAWLRNCVELLGLDMAWTTLLFHAEEWPLLVVENLLAKDVHDALTQSNLGHFLSQSLIPLRIQGYWTASSGAKHIVPLGSLLRTAFQIAENRGINRIGDGSVLTPILCYGDVEPVSKQEANLLLQRALTLPQLPPAWFAAVLRLCLLTPEVDFELLFQFWKLGSVASYHHLSIPGDELPDTCNKIVAKLLTHKEMTALQFATNILASGRTSRDNLNRFYEIIMSNNLSTDDKSANYVLTRAILSQMPSLEEFEFWGKWNDLTSKTFGENPWLYRQLLKRFQDAIQSKDLNNWQELRKRFMPFIIRRRDFPWQVPCAALEAILKLDERSALPLKDSDWQQTA